MLHLDFHGVRVAIDGDAREVIDGLRRDFSLFVTPPVPGRADVTLSIWDRPPVFPDAPDARCVMVKPNCVVYDIGGERWVDYQGRGAGRWRYAGESGELWSADRALAHEAAYLLVLSRVGELHDRRGIHRVHAVGLAVGDAGVLCFLPSGGGKTTLGLLALARAPNARLLSDDTPLVTRGGDILAFPSRVGCVGAPPIEVDARHVRTFHRTEYGAKTLIDADAFADRVIWRARPRAVIVGERALSGPPRLERVRAHRAAPELLRSVVVGVGLPQVVEYFLRFDVADAARKSALVASRALACASLLRRAPTYRFVLGRDVDANAGALVDLLAGLA